jgi:osmoprotectant transport system permease protein
MVRRQSFRWILLVISITAFIILLINLSWWKVTLHFFFPSQIQVIYPSNSLLSLVARHLELVLISSCLTVLIGVPLGIWVTRPSGIEFQPIVNDLTSLGQTFPPVAVLALAVPLFGFGLVPTVIALFLYGLLPVIRNTIAGIRSVPVSLVDAAYGMGMSRFQALIQVELPMAYRVILAGIRISIVINVGTAMIGAVIGAGGLGSPIIAGLVQLNTAYVIEGAVPAAILAILIDQFLANIESSFAYSAQTQMA